MKKEFSIKPEAIKENWPGELSIGAWQDLITGIPAPLLLATTYKNNGKENACLQSWCAFSGDGQAFVCLLSSVSKGGHLYQSLKETGCCVLNFPSLDVYARCKKTIENNGFDDEEITLSGLTAEKAVTIQAPRVAECFLNIECTYLWEHALYEGSANVVLALKATHICMDSDRYDSDRLGRYGKTGYLYNINSPVNPDTGARVSESVGCIGSAE